MNALKDFVAIDRRGSLYYDLPMNLSPTQKAELMGEFTHLHSDKRSWAINMHMTKRSMPFAIYGKVSFRGTKGHNINRLIVHFDNSSVSSNTNEQRLVWDSMKNVESYIKFWKGEYKVSNKATS